MIRSRFRHVPAGFSLIEVLVAMAILLAGIVTIAGFFPMMLGQDQRAADTAQAAYLAQLKAEEIRRDDSQSGALIAAIRARTTPTDPVVFGFDDRFAYSLSGVSLLDPVNDPADPTDDPGVARIIVRYSADFNSDEDLLYELRFDD